MGDAMNAAASTKAALTFMVAVAGRVFSADRV